ncbi:MAG: hypothetical protein AABW65_02320 [Nanoarchaeota archaeon]
MIKEEIKKKYGELAKEYKLPSFKELNDDFEIEEIEKNNENFLRTIRKFMMKKIFNSLEFLEMLGNPQNPPRLYLNYIMSISQEEKKENDVLYSSLGELILNSLSLEINPSEKKEAEAIKKIYSVWNSQKERFKKIIDKIQKPNNIINKKEKTYFG